MGFCRVRNTFWQSAFAFSIATCWNTRALACLLSTCFSNEFLSLSRNVTYGSWGCCLMLTKDCLCFPASGPAWRAHVAKCFTCCSPSAGICTCCTGLEKSPSPIEAFTSTAQSGFPCGSVRFSVAWICASPLYSASHTEHCISVMIRRHIILKSRGVRTELSHIDWIKPTVYGAPMPWSVTVRRKSHRTLHDKASHCSSWSRAK